MAVGVTFNFRLGLNRTTLAVKANPEAAAHQAAYDAYMTGVVYTLLRDHYPRPGGIEPYVNLVTVFGSNLFLNLNGEDHYGDLTVFALRVPVVGRNRPTREAVRALLLTEAQEQAIAAAEAKAAQTGEKFVAPPVDFYVDVLERSSSGDSDDATAVVAFFPERNTTAVVREQDVLDRLKGVASRHAGEASSSSQESPPSQSPDENGGNKRRRSECGPLDASLVTVTAFSAWKEDSKKIRSRSSSSLSQQS